MPIPLVLLGDSSTRPWPSRTEGNLVYFFVNHCGGFFRKMGKAASFRFPSPMHEAFGSHLGFQCGRLHAISWKP